MSELEKLLLPIKQEGTKIRVGWPLDGGYICLDTLLKPEMKVLSFGVGPCIEFEKHVLNQYNAEVVCYDESVDIPEQVLSEFPRLSFHKQHVTKDNVNEIFDAYEGPLTVQMDIEGAEFEFLESISDENLNKIESLILEFHFGWPMYVPIEKIKAGLKRLNSSHVCYHIHGNNHLQQFVPNTRVPMALECSYIRKDLSTGEEVDDAECPIEGLDFPNAPNIPDMKLNWWISK